MNHLARLGRRVAEVQDADRRSRRSAELGAENFIQKLRRKQRRSPARQVAVAALLLMTAAMALVFGALALRPPSEAVGSASPEATADRAIVVPQDQTIPVHFSDGSKVFLASATRATVRQLSAHEVKVTLDAGKGDFSVLERQETRWVVLAGPYRVRVIGAMFGLQWSPDDDRLVLELTDGSVVVSTRNGSRSVVEMIAPQHLAIERGVWKLKPLHHADPAPLHTRAH